MVVKSVDSISDMIIFDKRKKALTPKASLLACSSSREAKSDRPAQFKRA
jgi:hypothetical protein